MSRRRTTAHDAADEAAEPETPEREVEASEREAEAAHAEAAASESEPAAVEREVAAQSEAAASERAAATSENEILAERDVVDPLPDELFEIPPIVEAPKIPIGPPRKRRRMWRPNPILPWLLFVVVAIAAFATGLMMFNNLIMPRLIHSGGETRVPDLANLTFEQAEKLIVPLGLQLSRAGERFDPSVPRGFIITQDPPAETPVRGKRRVLVTVSLGEEFSSVPGLFGESVRSARVLIERAGLRMGGISRAPSDEVGEGLIVASDPPAETVLPRDTPVSLLVSSGGGEESFVMPDLMGREIVSARRQLEVLGFRVLTPPSAPSVGSIVFQDPPPGSRITRNSTVLLQAAGRMIR